MTVGELVRFAVGRGAWFPVLPGHPAITVGGCVAFNVHGKSQHDVGCFSDHVVSLTLLHPDHGELVCSPNDNAGIFELTLGGMGLTGYIATITLQLQPLPGRGIRRTAHPVANLTEAVELMQSLAASGDGGGTLYSWNDLNQRGRELRSWDRPRRVVRTGGAAVPRPVPPARPGPPAGAADRRGRGSRPACSTPATPHVSASRAAGCDRWRTPPFRSTATRPTTASSVGAGSASTRS